MERTLSGSIRYLKGVGPKRAKLFASFGINTLEDLLYYFPRRYEDRTNFTSISDLKEGPAQSIKAVISAKKERRSFRRGGFSVLEVDAQDATGKVRCVWFNQPYLKDYFKVGSTLILNGKIERYGGRLQINSPEFEFISPGQDESLNMGRIVPVYSLPSGMTQRYFRKTLKRALDENLSGINDFLPYDLRSRSNLPNLARSLINIHFPDDFRAQKDAHARLSFEEFFLFQLPLALRKAKNRQRQGIAHKVEGELAQSFIANLPFKLTSAQEKALNEIKSDMSSPQAMQRLLQGDVGSGKTVVAACASLIAIQGGYQAAFMAPTEVLARQHYEKIICQLSAVSCQQKETKLRLLTGSLDKKEKKKTLRDIKEGKIDLIIGTHALLEEDVEFSNLGLVIVDEQHKFGVGQRALLPQKGRNPDVLIMTATPIPRTLAITLYGDLDISVINELPPGRLPIKTMLFSQSQRRQAYDIAKEQLNKGNQAYIVYPVIEESYALDMAGAKKMYEQLAADELKEFRIGLIHGRLKQAAQNELMLKFKRKELDALVSTTVLEVGIDVPSATCMLIENAERFGLAQLHQLRGRIGRGAQESFCMLISDCPTPEAKARLEAMIHYKDGFRIAEEDLRLRGPGEFFGRRQSGLAELKLANPLTQMHLLKRAREEALRLINADPGLELKQNHLLKEELLRRFPEYEKLMVIG